MKDVLSEVSALKQSAKANRDFRDFDDALKDLSKALEILLKELNLGQQSGKLSVFKDELYLKKIAHEISDCYGMLGGIYRRQGNLDNAKEMYNKGASFEQDKNFEIQDTYNLFNSIVVPILQDPLCLEKQKNNIQATLQLLEDQVRGKRRNQWWAWADLGTLYILLNKVDTAKLAYSRFVDLGARLVDYESSISVLVDLYKALNKTHPSVASSIEQGIKYLEKCQSYESY